MTIPAIALLFPLAIVVLVAWRHLRTRRDIEPGYHGPAVLEVFGHTRHVGWIRCEGDRIDVLTVGGEALQVAASARFRLTPMTWSELAREALRERSRREEEVSEYRDDIRDLRSDVDTMHDRLAELRRSLDDIRMAPALPMATQLARDAIAADDKAIGVDAECPF